MGDDTTHDAPLQPTPAELGFIWSSDGHTGLDEEGYWGPLHCWLLVPDDHEYEFRSWRDAQGRLVLEESYDTDHDLTHFEDAAAMARYLWLEHPEYFPAAEPWGRDG